MTSCSRRWRNQTLRMQEKYSGLKVLTSIDTKCVVFISQVHQSHGRCLRVEFVYQLMQHTVSATSPYYNPYADIVIHSRARVTLLSAKYPHTKFQLYHQIHGHGRKLHFIFYLVTGQDLRPLVCRWTRESVHATAVQLFPGVDTC